MTKIWRMLIAVAVICLLPLAANAQGTIPLSLAQQVDANGIPLAGCLLYSYVAGTVATPQNSFQDFGLTIPNPNPLRCDVTGRVPLAWYQNGLIHVRLTDASGNVIVDTTMQVLGPSSGGGGGGGGGTVDPTSVASTGDIKFRLTSEILTGWVILNGQTIGNPGSGATQRANTDTQNLFVYLWTNCAQPSSNNHCQVVGGIGSSALADYTAGKQITLPDMRDKQPVGRDCMGNICAGNLLALNVTSGNGDGVDTPGATGGVANQTIAQANFPNVNFSVSGISVSSSFSSFALTGRGSNITSSGNGAPTLTNDPPNATSNETGGSTATITSTVTSQGTAASGGYGTALPVMNPFALGNWYQKL
jgi:hypothetical protein